MGTNTDDKQLTQLNRVSSALSVLTDLRANGDDIPPAGLSAYPTGTTDVYWYLNIRDLDGDEQKATAAAILRAINRVRPGSWAKDDKVEGWLRFTRKIDGVGFEVVVAREAVCERIVVGTETVIREITDPDAPKVTVTEDVEKVEWRCGPVLTAAATEGAA